VLGSPTRLPGRPYRSSPPSSILPIGVLANTSIDAVTIMRALEIMSLDRLFAHSLRRG
jgi:hypothetical protein